MRIEGAAVLHLLVLDAANEDSVPQRVHARPASVHHAAQVAVHLLGPQLGAVVRAELVRAAFTKMAISPRTKASGSLTFALLAAS